VRVIELRDGRLSLEAVVVIEHGRDFPRQKR
jgi:hypothetical protein